MAASQGTTWHPRTTVQPKSWLLANGEIVTEPALEETASGRKIRIPGTTRSVFAKEVDDLIYLGVQNIAAGKQTHVWMPLNDKQRRVIERGDYGNALDNRKPALHLLTAGGQTYGSGKSTLVWWRYRHATLPIEALLIVRMLPAYHGYGRTVTSNQVVSTTLYMPSTSPAQAESITYLSSNQAGMDDFVVGDRTARLRFSEFVRDSKPNWFGDFHPTEETLPDRAAVKWMIHEIEAIDSFIEIDVPDLRDATKPAWLRLDLQDSNVTAEFVQSLKDFLDGDSVIEEVKKHWDEIVRLFKTSGLVLEEKDEASFATALAGGEPVTIQVASPPQEVGNGYDHAHSVTLHLPSGTVIVNCTNANKASRNEIAEKWEESLVMASLTGKQDQLLAYAERFVETTHERRSKQILNERKTQ